MEIRIEEAAMAELSMFEEGFSVIGSDQDGGLSCPRRLSEDLKEALNL